MIFAEFERLVAFLTSAKVCCELRTDGSFLTEKNDPDDIDLSFSAWADHLDTLDPNLRNFLFRNLNGNKAYSPVLDTYICVRFSRDDPRRAADKTDYWAQKWGVGWDSYLKGYAAIKLWRDRCRP